MRRVLLPLLLALGLCALPAGASAAADFGRETASADARHVADWALHAGDAAGLPYIVVDKVQARLYVFDGGGRLLGATAALLGSAAGDASVPGIGARKLSTIRPEERTTPAGRFVASIDRSLAGEDILWVDYDAAVALHRVIATQPAERRLQRLESRVPADRRITYGCINVPVKFFEQVVAPAFRAAGGIVYVLPESGTARATFGSYEVGPASAVAR